MNPSNQHPETRGVQNLVRFITARLNPLAANQNRLVGRLSQLDFCLFSNLLEKVVWISFENFHIPMEMTMNLNLASRSTDECIGQKQHSSQTT